MELYRNDLLSRLTTFAQKRSSSVALSETSGREIAFAALMGRVDALAANLATAGFRKGDRALLLVRPGVDAVVSLLGILRAGGVLVAADIAMGEEAFNSRVSLAAPQWIFVESAFLALQKLAIARRFLRGRGVEIPEIPNLKKARVVSAGPSIPGVRAEFTLSALSGPLRLEPQIVDIDPTDDAAIIFTSGTTDLPKGVVHTHASINAMLNLLVEFLAIGESDVLYGALIQVIAPALYSGIEVVVPRKKFSAETWLSDVERNNVTIVFGPPSEFEEIAQYCQQTGRTLPSSLRTIVLGSAPVHAAFLSRLSAIVPQRTRVWCMYGLTEVLPVAAMLMSDKLQYANDGDVIGRPLSGIRARIASDRELLVTGPNLFNRYLGGEPTAEAQTGDLASIDEDGNIVLHGRKKDMIIRGNYNIYPGMVEPTISRIPGVRDCCLVGVYDERIADEKIVLVVEKDDPRPEPEFRRFLEKQLLSGQFSIDQYAMPDQTVFAPIPRSGRSQKIDRVALRKQLEQTQAVPTVAG